MLATPALAQSSTSRPPASATDVILALLPLAIIILLAWLYYRWRKKRNLQLAAVAASESVSTTPIDTDEAFKRGTASSANIFSFFGHAITTVTWISLCVVTVFVLIEIARVQEVRELRGGGIRLVWGGILATGLAAISSSALLFFTLLATVKRVHTVYIATQKGFMGWFRKNLAALMFNGAAYLVLVIAGALSFQALLALGLWPI